MKILLGLLGLLTLTVQQSVLADPLPSSVTQALHVREQQLNRLAFSWVSTNRQTAPQKSPERVLSLQKATQKQLPEILRRKGITDNATIQKIVTEQVREVPNMLKGFSNVSTYHLEIARNSGKTLVNGTKQQGRSLTEYSQFYENNSNLIVNRVNKVAGGNKISLDTPKVYGCQGDSVRYYVPSLMGLDMLPEHFVMLAGLNPLAIYGAAWQSTAAPSSWLLVSQIEQPHQPLTTIKLTLDKKHDNAPSVIEVHRGNMFIVARTLQYKRYKGTWISSEVDFVTKSVGISSTSQRWTLKAVLPITSVSAKLQTGANVIDYRLLGPSPNLLATSASQADNIRKNAVIYRWTGQFLDINQLEKIRNRQHPGEAFPDLGQSVSAPAPFASTSSVINITLPLAGGALCLAGGVWMFKQRKAN